VDSLRDGPSTCKRRVHEDSSAKARKSPGQSSPRKRPARGQVHPGSPAVPARQHDRKRPGRSPRRRRPAWGRAHPLNFDLDMRIHREGPVPWARIAAVVAGLGGLAYWASAVIRTLGK
jgi:hypothetical protein